MFIIALHYKNKEYKHLTSSRINILQNLKQKTQLLTFLSLLQHSYQNHEDENYTSTTEDQRIQRHKTASHFC
jgi:hypothetical protein